MKPTLELERMHTFKSFRQFPELRKSVSAIENIAFASADPLYHMRSGAIRRKKQQTSTHRLAELSQSSLSDVSSVMDDFRRIMIDNRRKNMALTGARLDGADCLWAGLATHFLPQAALAEAKAART
eukprot:gene9139-11733_t